MDRPLTLTWMYTLGRLEAVSFLLLLGVAMPLKYAGGVLWATPWFGWIHGLLFLQFLVALGSEFEHGIDVLGGGLEPLPGGQEVLDTRHGAHHALCALRVVPEVGGL